MLETILTWNIIGFGVTLGVIGAIALTVFVLFVFSVLITILRVLFEYRGDIKTLKEVATCSKH